MNIIDDCVSALDVNTQQQFRDRLLSCLKNSSHSVIIATNCKTLLSVADRLLVMKGGSVIAEGIYDDLLVSCDEFASLMQ